MSAAREEITLEDYPGLFYNNSRLYLKDIMPNILEGNIEYLTALINRGFFHQDGKYLEVARALVESPQSIDRLNKIKLLFSAGCPLKANIDGTEVLLVEILKEKQKENAVKFFEKIELKEKKKSELEFLKEVENIAKDLGELENKQKTKSSENSYRTRQEEFITFFAKDNADLLSNTYNEQFKRIKDLLKNGVIVNNNRSNGESILVPLLSNPISVEHAKDDITRTSKNDNLGKPVTRSIRKKSLIMLLAQHGADFGSIGDVKILNFFKDADYTYNIAKLIEGLRSDEYLNACKTGRGSSYLDNYIEGKVSSLPKSGGGESAAGPADASPARAAQAVTPYTDFTFASPEQVAAMSNYQTHTPSATGVIPARAGQTVTPVSSVTQTPYTDLKFASPEQVDAMSDPKDPGSSSIQNVRSVVTRDVRPVFTRAISDIVDANDPRLEQLRLEQEAKRQKEIEEQRLFRISPENSSIQRREAFIRREKPNEGFIAAASAAADVSADTNNDDSPSKRTRGENDRPSIDVDSMDLEKNPEHSARASEAAILARSGVVENDDDVPERLDKAKATSQGKGPEKKDRK